MVDGGPFSGRWQTTFTFSNPNDKSVSVNLYFYDDDGGVLPMSFGQGLVTQTSFSIPPFGSRALVSAATSQTIKIGWAYANSTSLVQGVVTYRLIGNGRPSYDVSVPGTQPTAHIFSPATESLAIAVANIYPFTLAIRVAANDGNGSVYEGRISVPPEGHRALLLSEAAPSLPRTFAGTVTLTAPNDGPALYFVGLTLRLDSNILSSLPSGAAVRPVFQVGRIADVFSKIKQAGRNSDLPSAETADLTISDDPEIVARGGFSGIQVNMALAALINDFGE